MRFFETIRAALAAQEATVMAQIKSEFDAKSTPPLFVD
jgi:hypothetical protein